MLKAICILGGTLLLVATAPSQANATSGAHFFPDTAPSVTDSGALSVYIDEAGVGQELVNYAIVWSAQADYGCINGGSNHPQASNKEGTAGGGTDYPQFNPENGRVEVTYLVPNTPPPAAPDFSCPPGQEAVLAKVTYTGTLTDLTNGAGPVSLDVFRTFFPFKK